MSAEVLVFDILAAVAIIFALAVVVARNPVHSAVSLLFTFINLAGIFVILQAEFLAVVQLIVYSGAVLVLVLFVIMLVRQDDLPEFHGGKPVQQAFAVLIGLALLGEVTAAILTRTAVGARGPWNEATVAEAGGNVQVLGQLLYSGYVLPVQIIAIILLVGTIAALVLARPSQLQLPGARRTSTPSLAHPRGTDRAIGALPSGVVAAAPHEEPGVTVRAGLIMVNNPDAFTDSPAWSGDNVVLAEDD